MWIDTHCHLALQQYDEDRDQVLEQIKKSGCKALMEVSIDFESTERMFSLFEDDELFYFSLGYHPHSADTFKADILDKYRSLLKNKKRIKAIGEAGLDVKSKVEFEKQYQVYRVFCEFAKETELPLIIHHRGYDDEILKPLEELKLNKCIFHCFSSGPDMLTRVMKLGAYASFSGIVTFKSAQEVKESAKKVPLDRLLVETDSPFLAPQKVRGQRNSPVNVLEIINEIANLRQMPVDELKEIVYENSLKAFDISL